MDSKNLELRTKQFALHVIRFVAALPRTKVADVVGYQLLKAGTSIGANYREANRAESRADFVHKIAIVEKEAAGTEYWLELCQEAHLGNAKECSWLLQEADELVAIFTSIGKRTELGATKSALYPHAIRNPKSAIRDLRFPIRNSQSAIRNFL